jgi:hypothetical protein
MTALFNKTNLCTIIIKHTKTLSLLKFKMLYVSQILILNLTCFDHHMTIIRGILVLGLVHKLVLLNRLYENAR